MTFELDKTKGTEKKTPWWQRVVQARVSCVLPKAKALQIMDYQAKSKRVTTQMKTLDRSVFVLEEISDAFVFLFLLFR